MFCYWYVYIREEFDGIVLLPVASNFLVLLVVSVQVVEPILQVVRLRTTCSRDNAQDVGAY